MAETEPTGGAGLNERIARIAPGLSMLAHYRRQDLPHDLVAGLSVAAVALPVGVAYAELAGFNPAVGLYSSILPLAAYALFGSSRQLIIGPDAATCALVAAAVATLAAGDPGQYLAFSMTLAFLAGVQTEVANWRVQTSVDKTRPTTMPHFPSLRAAVEAFIHRTSTS